LWDVWAPELIINNAHIYTFLKYVRTVSDTFRLKINIPLKI